MKKFLVTLHQFKGAIRPLEADVELHETDCPNLARRLLRQNKGHGHIQYTSDMQFSLSEQISGFHTLGLTTQYTLHTKRAGKGST